ncbi:MAG: hypothetical protein PHF21_00285, partial [Bacilli bacterium]|nr:hypothetical protein [Bacilli bacterium]
MKKFKKQIFHFLFLLGVLLIIIQYYIYNTFGSIDLRQIIFHIDMPRGITSGNVLLKGVLYVIPKFLILGVIYILINIIYSKTK